MSVGERLSELASIFLKRMTVRVLALQRVLELDSFFLSLGDEVDGSWAYAAAGWRDLSGFVTTWRRQVDEITLDAAQIGDKEFSRLAGVLASRKEAVAVVLSWPSSHDVDDPPPIPEDKTELGELIRDMEARLRKLIGNARRLHLGMLGLACLVALGLAAAALT
jgi:hypothetical protein